MGLGSDSQQGIVIVIRGIIIIIRGNKKLKIMSGKLTRKLNRKRRKGVKKTNGNRRGVLAAFHHPTHLYLCLLNSRANYMRKKKAHGNCL